MTGHEPPQGRLDKGGFANAEIPEGFERAREPHVDAPLSKRGKLVFYSALAVVTIGGIVLIVFSIR